MIDDFVSNHGERSISFTSMGHLNYLSALQYVDGVVGNSSSGLTEVPTFKIGTVNIGDRQKGRMKAVSVIDCEPTRNSVKKAITSLYSKEFRSSLSTTINPYGEGKTSEKILEVIQKEHLPEELKKVFYDL